MSFQRLSLIVFGAFGACSLAAACTYEQPTAAGNGGDGGAGTGGSSSSSTVTGSSTSSTVSGSSTSSGFGGGAGAGGMPANWWNPAWSHRVRITFRNDGAEPLTDFPLMIRLDASRIQSSQVSPTGADVRFLDDDGKTILPHELDGWKPDGNSYVWVRVPSIEGTDTDHIWLYYGNSAADDIQDAKKVWTDFIGVYHLSPSGSPAQFVDSAGVASGAWENNQAGAITSGPINNAIYLDGQHFVHIGDNDRVAADPGDARTVEAWVNTSQVRDQAIVYEEGQCVGWFLGINTSGHYQGNFVTAPTGFVCTVTPTTDYTLLTPATLGSWHYLTLVVDRPGGEMRLFVDGQPASATPINNTEIADGNGVFRIGSDHDGGDGTFIGTIDEVRVSSIAHSPGWIAAQYKSMSDTFLEFSVE